MVNNGQNIGITAIRNIVEQVPDPEIPVLTIGDMGILRDIHVETTPGGENSIEVVITPTYTGCPAMDMISMNIRMALQEQGYNRVKITSVLSPAWTTDWMTESGKLKLKQYGIAPPVRKANGEAQSDEIPCPQCGSANTRLISQFGSTACKALYQCNDCREPFDYFKCH